jgi:hypothetical protein
MISGKLKMGLRLVRDPLEAVGGGLQGFKLQIYRTRVVIAGWLTTSTVKEEKQK